MLRILAVLAILGGSVSANATATHASAEGPQERALDQSLQQDGEDPAAIVSQAGPAAGQAVAPPAAKTIPMKKQPSSAMVKNKSSAKSAEGPQELSLDRGDEPVSNKPDPQSVETSRLNGGY